MYPTPDQLAACFPVAGLSFRDAGDGFVMADIDTAHCTASVALQGAHLSQWQPKSQAQSVVWCSPVAKFAHGKSIRGGVPVCWPWFGAHPGEASFPGHGFARTVPWSLDSAGYTGDGAIELAFSILPSEAGAKQWPHATPAILRMKIGAVLEMELTTRNDSGEAITLGQALHTYFTVGDIRDCSITGLEGCDYLDKVDGGARKQQEGAIVIGSEVDRIYLGHPGTARIVDRELGRTIRIDKRGSNSSIVWNPWLEKCVKMGDFGSDEGFLGMVCVESANAADDVVQLAPGQSHSLWVCYSIE